MAELAASTNGTLFTFKNSTVALVRGARVTFDSTGACVAAASTVRGDYVTATAVAAGTATVDVYGAGYSMQEGAIVPAVAAGTIAVGDAIYSDASGKWGNTSSGHVLIGKAITAASGVDVLFEVLIQTVA